MKYRKFSNMIDFQPSAIGFGLMRLPMKDEKNVDIDEAIRIVRYGIDQGVNYLDTAYVYHGGESEKICREILKDGYRDKVKIADKMPMWLIKEEADLDRIFFEQLEKLGTDKIDFYLMHALSARSLPALNKTLFNWAERKQADGHIGYIGFSFHDKLSILKKIIDIYDWSFCMLQYNIVDIKTQLPHAALRYAYQKGLGVIIMEGLRGGQLTASIPDKIMSLWTEFADIYDISKCEPVRYMLDWLWNQKEVAFVISGMSNFKQVEENVRFAKQACEIGSWKKKHHDKIKDIQKAYFDTIAINCTQCNYCKNCPIGVSIPRIFNLLNEIKRYENQRTPSFHYNFITEDKRANKCDSCGDCVPLCPQKLNIPELLIRCRRIFEDKEEFNRVFKS